MDTTTSHSHSSAPAQQLTLPPGPVQVQGNIQTTTQATVSVKDLPVIETHHDWLDYTSCGVSFALLLVGIGGVWYAKRTLDAIQGQLNEITKAGLQTDLMITEARRQADAATASANGARDTARLTQCADVLLDEVQLGNNVGSVEHLSRLVLTFKNFGPTRAINLTLDFTFIPGVTGDYRLSRNPVVLGANATISVIFPTIRELNLVANIPDMNNGRMPLRFNGTILYEDVFGKNHGVRCDGDYNINTRQFKTIQSHINA